MALFGDCQNTSTGNSNGIFCFAGAAIPPSSSKSISPYVLALSQTITDNYADMDLLRMMTYVNYTMMNVIESIDGKNEKMQLEVPQIMSMLTKDLYFPPRPQRISAPATESVCVECDDEANITEL
jgi:hypothetical protein